MFISLSLIYIYQSNLSTLETYFTSSSSSSSSSLSFYSYSCCFYYYLTFYFYYLVYFDLELVGKQQTIDLNIILYLYNLIKHQLEWRKTTLPIPLYRIVKCLHSYQMNWLHPSCLFFPCFIMEHLHLIFLHWLHIPSFNVESNHQFTKCSWYSLTLMIFNISFFLALFFLLPYLVRSTP